jgi:AraC family transcriptional regulator
MEPRIEILAETKLVGKKLRMSFGNDRTFELWSGFSPRQNEIKNRMGNNRFSVQIYPRTDFFEKFDPLEEFEKWAAVEVSEFTEVPGGMEALVIPKGDTAVYFWRLASKFRL